MVGDVSLLSLEGADTRRSRATNGPGEPLRCILRGSDTILNGERDQVSEIALHIHFSVHVRLPKAHHWIIAEEVENIPAAENNRTLRLSVAVVGGCTVWMYNSERANSNVVELLAHSWCRIHTFLVTYYPLQRMFGIAHIRFPSLRVLPLYRATRNVTRYPVTSR
jgi:hypothetical protein